MSKSTTIIDVDFEVIGQRRSAKWKANLKYDATIVFCLFGVTLGCAIIFLSFLLMLSAFVKVFFPLLIGGVGMVFGIWWAVTCSEVGTASIKARRRLQKGPSNG